MNWAQEWRDAVAGSFGAILDEVGRFLPNLLGFVLILMVGYAVSRLLARVTTPALRRIGLDRAVERAGAQRWVERFGVDATPSALLGRCVFWLFMLVFFVSATDALGLDNVSRTIQTFVAWIPNLIAAFLILIAGLLLARFLSQATARGLSEVAPEHARLGGRLVFGLALAVVAVAAVSQLQLEITLVSRVIEILILAVGAGAALTLGLGTRDVARNIFAGIYLRDVYRPGMQIVTETGARGAVAEVSTVNTRLTADSGETVWVPNRRMLDLVVETAPTG